MKKLLALTSFLFTLSTAIIAQVVIVPKSGGSGGGGSGCIVSGATGDVQVNNGAGGCTATSSFNSNNSATATVITIGSQANASNTGAVSLLGKSAGGTALQATWQLQNNGALDLVTQALNPAFEVFTTDGSINTKLLLTVNNDPVVSIVRTISPGGNSHGFQDSTIYGTGSGAYAPFDSFETMNGLNQDHIVSFQARPTIAGTGTMIQLSGFTDIAAVNQAITTRYGAWINDPTGSGSITNNYGIRVESMVMGGTLKHPFDYAGTWFVDSTNQVTSTKTALGTTTADSEFMQNTTAAALGAQQVSPASHWAGRGWETNTSASQTVEYRAFVLPVQGAANPTGLWQLQSQVNAGGFANQLTIDTSGNGVFTGYVSGLQYASGTTDGIYASYKQSTINDTATIAVHNFSQGGDSGRGQLEFAGGVELPNNRELGFTNNTFNNSGAVDVALFRNAAGVLEINSGTSGTFRDLKIEMLRTGQTTVPTCTGSCGTSPSVAGSDTAMTVTLGTGSPASPFTVTFNHTWATAPACTAANDQSQTTQYVTGVVVTTTTVAITTAAAPSVSTKYNIICIGIS